MKINPKNIEVLNRKADILEKIFGLGFALKIICLFFFYFLGFNAEKNKDYDKAVNLYEKVSFFSLNFHWLFF